MKVYIVELPDDGFDTIFADTLEEAECEAYKLYGFDYLEVHEEE